MLGRKAKGKTTQRSDKKSLPAKQEVESLLGDARAEADQIGMSATKMNLGLDKVVDCSRNSGETQKEQEQKIVSMQQKLEELQGKVLHLQQQYEAEVTFRQKQQEHVLELMDQSKHYTSLVKALQSDPEGPEGETLRREKLQQLVKLLKENNIVLGHMAKDGSQQQKCAEAEPAFHAKQAFASLWEQAAVILEQSQETGRQQEKLLSEMETVGSAYMEQQESIEKLDQILETCKQQLVNG